MKWQRHRTHRNDIRCSTLVHAIIYDSFHLILTEQMTLNNIGCWVVLTV